MNTTRDSNEIANLLRTLIIIQLGLANVPQASIRRVVGGDIRKINSILKNVKPKKINK